MEDFCYAGGLPAVMRELGDLLHAGALTVSPAKTVGGDVAARLWTRRIIAFDSPAAAGTGYDGASPAKRRKAGGAVIKQSAAVAARSSPRRAPSSSTRLSVPPGRATRTSRSTRHVRSSLLRTPRLPGHAETPTCRSGQAN